VTQKPGILFAFFFIFFSFFFFFFLALGTPGIEGLATEDKTELSTKPGPGLEPDGSVGTITTSSSGSDAGVADTVIDGTIESSSDGSIDGRTGSIPEMSSRSCSTTKSSSSETNSCSASAVATLISPTGSAVETRFRRLLWRTGILIEGPVAGDADLERVVERERERDLDLERVRGGEPGATEF
jgi:hypothetical protein